MTDRADNPLLHAFERLLARAPSAPLVIGRAAVARAADVDAAARAAGTVLAAAPPVPGEPLGLAAAGVPAFLAGLVALLRAGAAPLLLDARTPAAEHRRSLAEVGATRLLRCAEPWPEDPGDWRLAGDGPAPPTADLRGGAVIKLTSGSSGAARGILTPVAALLADDAALTAAMGIGRDDRLLAAIPLSHSYGLASLALPALVRGTPLVVAGGSDPFAPLAAAVRAEATVFPTVPAYLGALLRLAEPPPLPPSLRLVLTAGAPLPAATSAGFRRRYGLPVHVFYGASECGGICYDREGGAAERGTVGTPVDGVTVEVAPVAGAGGGRVVVRSPAIARGYLPEPDHRLGGGRFLTEDLAEWRDGELVLVGRLGDIINVRGKKVNPREVESILAQLAAVDDVAVVGLPAAGAGADDPQVRAVVACRPGSLTAEEVLAWCQGRLAEHKRPRSVVLVDRMPRTHRGKLDRTTLARVLAGDAPGQTRPSREPGAAGR